MENTSPSAPNLNEAHPSSWFDPLYARAQGNADQVPWVTLKPQTKLLNWIAKTQPPTENSTAIVVGCGLGDDAQVLSEAGYQVTAFDISPTAIAWCKTRFPNSTVQYQVADLFQLPEDWVNHFDVVFESITIQALPLTVRQQTMTTIRSLLAPSGTLLVATYLRPNQMPPVGPPWPLTDSELAYFEHLGLYKVAEQRYRKKDSSYPDRIFLEYCS